ncbi:NUDIX domain-containing protein [Nocardia vermiculata]|uniref:NUDIX domain-containing protein n=1 Tax=Nocardia vermiculata TaxID=257274 RepID=A0A846Y5Z8_9NOCA|nr:NUDIX domain-containing protein [Nocardia vermiculata]NKY54267.1 NUDIX domain-containing protein [Nocardia vermiculata]
MLITDLGEHPHGPLTQLDRVLLPRRHDSILHRRSPGLTEGIHVRKRRECRRAPIGSDTMESATAVVADLVGAITPVDDLEQEHIEQTLSWLARTDDIYRRIPPAIPSPHLVAYVVLVDPGERGVYLGRHRKSGLHLPMGGHVEIGEHPLAAARREAVEELGVEVFFDVVGERPFLLTVTPTVGPSGGHVDTSLWYVARGCRLRDFDLDPTEFDGGRWWGLDPCGLPDTDPHLPRFIRKLDSFLQPATT